MSVDIILKDIEWDGVNKIRVPLEGGGTQDFSIGGGSANLQTKSKTYTPTASQQTDTVSPDSGYDGLSSVNVTVNAVSSGSVVSEISYTDTEPSVTVDNSGIVHVSGGYSATTHPISTSGWVDSSATTEVEIGVMGTYQLPTQGATTITPSTSQQTAVTSGKYTTGNVVVSAVPSMTLPATTSTTPTGTRRANLYPSTSQQYLNIPAGLNDTARYYQIIGMDLAPLNVTQNGTYNASDVDITGFNTVTVNVSSGTPTLQTKSASYTPTTTQQTDTITADSGYDGLDAVNITIHAMPSGSSNLETGTFTTSSSAGVGSVLVGYIGSGYPIACMVFVEGGSYVSGTDWYNSKQRYAVGFWSMSKSVQGTAPDYGTSGTQNQGVVTSVYKNSTSSATSYTRTSAMNNNVYTSNNASNSALNVIKLKANNVLSYYTNTSSYGLLPNTTYRYYIIYSS